MTYAEAAPGRGLSVAGGSKNTCPARQARESVSIEFKSNQRSTRGTSRLVFTRSECRLYRGTAHVPEPRLFVGSELSGRKARAAHCHSYLVKAGAFPGICL